MNGLPLYTQKAGGGAGQASIPLTCGQDVLSITKIIQKCLYIKTTPQEITVEFKANQCFTSFHSRIYFFLISPLSSLNLTRVTSQQRLNARRPADGTL